MFPVIFCKLLVLGTRSTIWGVLEGKASSLHGEFFLIIFYKYQFELTSRGMYCLVLLWRKLVFWQLHFLFLQGCTWTNSIMKIGVIYSLVWGRCWVDSIKIVTNQAQGGLDSYGINQALEAKNDTNIHYFN